MPSEGDQLDFVELDGELCLAQYMATQIVMWMVAPSGDDYNWKQIHVINLLDAWKSRPLGMINGGIIVCKGNYLYRYHEASETARELVCVVHLRYKNPNSGSVDFKVQDCFFFNIRGEFSSISKDGMQ